MVQDTALYKVLQAELGENHRERTESQVIVGKLDPTLAIIRKQSVEVISQISLKQGGTSSKNDAI